MAGLGEVCIHVKMVLFYIETAVKLNGTTTCPSNKHSCIVPSYIPSVPTGKLDFTSVKTKMKELSGSELSVTFTFSSQLSKITELIIYKAYNFVPCPTTCSYVHPTKQTIQSHCMNLAIQASVMLTYLLSVKKSNYHCLQKW